MYYLAHQEILSAITGPNRGLALVVAGILGICLEFLRPGLVIPGVTGSVLLVLGFHSLLMFPLRDVDPRAAGIALSLLMLLAGWLLPIAYRARRNKTARISQMTKGHNPATLGRGEHDADRR